MLQAAATEFDALKAWITRHRASVEDLLAAKPIASRAVVQTLPSTPHVPRQSLAACIDIETTDFSPRTDAITEVAIALSRYNQDTGEILGIEDLQSFLEEPRVPIPPRVARLTSITTQLTQGRVIDWTLVSRIIDQAAFLIAHNAEFEHRFLSQIPGLINSKLLLCSQLLPTWHKPGMRESVRLEDVTAAHGIPHDAHRAYGDVVAMVKLLAVTSPITGAPYFAEVLRALRTPSLPKSATQARGQGSGQHKGRSRAAAQP